MPPGSTGSGNEQSAVKQALVEALKELGVTNPKARQLSTRERQMMMRLAVIGTLGDSIMADVCGRKMSIVQAFGQAVLEGQGTIDPPLYCGFGLSLGLQDSEVVNGLLSAGIPMVDIVCGLKLNDHKLLGAEHILNVIPRTSENLRILRSCGFSWNEIAEAARNWETNLALYEALREEGFGDDGILRLFAKFFSHNSEAFLLCAGQNLEQTVLQYHNNGQVLNKTLLEWCARSKAIDFSEISRVFLGWAKNDQQISETLCLLRKNGATLAEVAEQLAKREDFHDLPDILTCLGNAGFTDYKAYLEEPVRAALGKGTPIEKRRLRATLKKVSLLPTGTGPVGDSR